MFPQKFDIILAFGFGVIRLAVVVGGGPQSLLMTQCCHFVVIHHYSVENSGLLPEELKLDSLHALLPPAVDVSLVQLVAFLVLQEIDSADLFHRYVGAASAPVGPFFEKDVNQTNHPDVNSQPTEGWPLWNDRQTFAGIAGYFDCQPETKGYNYQELQDRGCESVISGVPHPLAINLVFGDQVLNSTVDKSTISKFTQTLRFTEGHTRWDYTWSPMGTNISFDISYATFASKLRPNVFTTQLHVTPQGGGAQVTVVDLLDGRSAVRSDLGEKGIDGKSIYVSNHPWGLPDITAWSFSTLVSDKLTNLEPQQMTPNLESVSDMSVSQQWDANLINGMTAVFTKFAGVASSDKFDDPRSTALGASIQASEDGWDVLFSEQKAIWNRIMDRNLITDYRDPVTGKLPVNETLIEKLQAAAVADRYYIMQNLVEPSMKHLADNGVAVGGLTSDTYGGMVFWDQEMWIFPGIAITSPDYAKQMIMSRIKHYAQAKANSQEDYVQEQYKFDNESVLYPWTTGRFGNATATGPVLNYEYHINPDIALAMNQYLAVTGDEEFYQKELWPVVQSVGQTISGLLEKDGDRWSIRNMTDPDEYAVSDISHLNILSCPTPYSNFLFVFFFTLLALN
jgi:trehalose/maltose hydrolase-like predicted phosphorylase